jgi:hypothetical protein
METNAHWASALLDSSENDQNLKDVIGYADLIASISLDEVKRAAAAWLTRPPVVVESTPAKPVGVGSAR